MYFRTAFDISYCYHGNEIILPIPEGSGRKGIAHVLDNLANWNYRIQEGGIASGYVGLLFLACLTPAEKSDRLL